MRECMLVIVIAMTVLAGIFPAGDAIGSWMATKVYAAEIGGVKPAQNGCISSPEQASANVGGLVEHWWKMEAAFPVVLYLPTPGTNEKLTVPYGHIADLGYPGKSLKTLLPTQEVHVEFPLRLYLLCLNHPDAIVVMPGQKTPEPIFAPVQLP